MSELGVNDSVLVAGGGFIGGWLVRALLARGCRVRAVDVKPLDEWCQLHAEADNRVADLREPHACAHAIEGTRNVFNLAADMGGMGYIEAHWARCMISVLINTNLRDRRARSRG